MTCDVFISFKKSATDGGSTPDAAVAREVYTALTRAGVKVFFSEESLAEAGKGHFSKTIESALESARVLVLVASSRAHIESQWVETEWDSFLNDVRSGNKQGEMFIVNCGDLRTNNLPLFLRRQQMFPAGKIAELVKFVMHALPSPASLSDFIKVSLHCHDPKKHEDKVYLMTVHGGTEAGTRHVTAFWGPRAAKRLNSQMKAVNVSDAAAQDVVKKAKLEKVRSGYAPKPFAKILNAEARAHLAAALGLSEVQPPPTRKAQSKRTGTSMAAKRKKK